MSDAITCKFFIDDLRNTGTRQLSATSNATRVAKSRFLVALEVKCNIDFLVISTPLIYMLIAPNQLAASLKMIASLAQIEPGGSREFPTAPLKSDHLFYRSLRSVET